jgi:hypothetical protein
MVVLNSPCRETPKTYFKKKSRKKSRMVGGGWVGLGFSKCTGPSSYTIWTKEAGKNAAVVLVQGAANA